MPTRLLMTLCAMSLLAACDDGGGGSSGGTPPDQPPPDDTTPATGSFVTAADDGCASTVMTLEDASHIGPGAAIGARVVDIDCNPLEDFKVLCCTAETCVPTDTSADGTFYLGGIMNELPRKIRVVGVTHGYYDALFYLGITPDELSLPSKAVILTPLDDYGTMDADAGGSVMLAGGQLEVHLEAGALKYPLGHFNPEMSAQRVSMDLVGPFDMNPADGVDGAMAFVFDPYDMSVDEAQPAALSFHVEDHGGVGAVYDIWSADTHNAHILAVGTATVDDSGVVRSDEGAAITSLQTIVLVPR